MYQLNFYRNLKSPRIEKTITIEEYISLIRDGYQIADITEARKHVKGTKPYDEIKETRACVTFNFLFKRYKKNQNITGTTGLLYFDFDIPIDQLDQSKIFLHHKSFGGKCSCIVVQVQGLNLKNFKTNYELIAAELSIPHNYDECARKATQFTVLSFDENLYYNPNSFVFKAISEKVSFPSKLEGEESISPRNETFHKDHPLGRSCRTTNASDYVDEDKDYEVFDQGIQVAKMNIPRKTPIGMRNQTLLSIINQLVSLNNHLTYDQIKEKGRIINRIFTKEPLPERQVMSIVNTIWEQKLANNLKPILNHTRKIIFNRKCKLSFGEKMIIVNQKNGVLRSRATQEKIRVAIECWDKSHKIDQKTVASKTGMSLSTIKLHWKIFKERVDKKNKLHRLETIAKVILTGAAQPEMTQEKIIEQGSHNIELPEDRLCIDELSAFKMFVRKEAPDRFNTETITKYFTLMNQENIRRTPINIRRTFLLI